MKWLLIASMLQMQPVYVDKETCELAAGQLRSLYRQDAAVCIPLPDDQIQPGAAEVDRVFNSFMQLVEKLQETDTKGLDKRVR